MRNQDPEPLQDSAEGFSSGLSVWVSGRYGIRGEGQNRKGPLPGLSRPPSILADSDRVSGRIGRPRVQHIYLDLVRSRLKVHQKRKKPIPAARDRLKGFRNEVWFLALAGYSPTFIMRLFLTELPNLFQTLSFNAVVYSVNRILIEARTGELLLSREYQQLLERYRSGPWAWDAPDWLKAQYGVGIPKDDQFAEVDGGISTSASLAKDQTPGQGAGLSVFPSGADELARMKAFAEAWKLAKELKPDLGPLTDEELELGLVGGVGAVMTSRRSIPVIAETARDHGLPATLQEYSAEPVDAQIPEVHAFEITEAVFEALSEQAAVASPSRDASEIPEKMLPEDVLRGKPRLSDAITALDGLLKALISPPTQNRVDPDGANKADPGQPHPGETEQTDVVMHSGPELNFVTNPFAET